MGSSRPFSDCGRDAASLSQAATTIVDASALGGDDSFRKQHRGSQGSGGNFSSQDKFSFTGSDTIDIMGSCKFALSTSSDSDTGLNLRSRSICSKRHQPSQKHDSDSIRQHGLRHDTASNQRNRGAKSTSNLTPTFTPLRAASTVKRFSNQNQHAKRAK
jgi:hypothetical protein